MSSGIGIHAKARSSLKLGFLWVFLAEAISGQGKSLGAFYFKNTTRFTFGSTHQRRATHIFKEQAYSRAVDRTCQRSGG
jgi:hypothetical protein